MQQQKNLNRRLFGKFSYLLGTLLALLIGVALADKGRTSTIVLCLLFTAVLLTAIATACKSQKTIWLGFAIAASMLSFSVAGYASDTWNVLLVHDVLAMMFFLYSSYHVLRAVLDDRRVTLDTIIGTICIYLLMGLAWTYLYSTLQLVDSSAFGLTAGRSGAYSSQRLGLQPLVYLSFVTMTTLGYGDITPLSPLAQTACYLQAVFGQFFLAVLVARLVTVHLARIAKPT